MKYIHAVLAVVCLLVVGGAIGAARANDQDEENKGVSLYTPADIGLNGTASPWGAAASPEGRW